MTRAERRRAEREAKKKTATYNLTEEQLDLAVKEALNKEVDKIKEKAIDDAINTSMVLMLTFPLYVLMSKYWKKSYAKRLPKFTDDVLELYEKYQNGELLLEKIQRDLWEIGGVKLEEVE